MPENTRRSERDELREQLEEFALHIKPGTTKGKHRTAIFDTLELANLVQALIASKVEEARIQPIKYLLTTIKSFDKYIVPGVNGGSELVDFGSVVNLLERDLKALQSKEGDS